jgi:polyisoprenoid-binding protein YceI
MSAQAPAGLGSGTHNICTDDAKLTIRTGRTGAIQKVGHNLLLEVTNWSGTLEVGERIAVTLTADPSSIRVLEGTGGIQALGDDDKANINQTIVDEVLGGGAIEYRSARVSVADCGLHVDGELELRGTRRPVSFELAIRNDGRLTGEAVIKQTDFGMKPYSALFGTLKVADEVRIAIEGHLPDTTQERSDHG